MFNHQLIYSFNDMAIMMASRYVPDSCERADVSGLSGVISKYLINLFLNNFDPVVAVNTYALIFWILSFISAYILFRKIFKDMLFSVMSSLIYSFSLYFFYRITSFTPALYAVFVFPMLFYFLYFIKSRVALGIFVFIMFLFSTYYGFFAVLTICLWEFSEFILKEKSFKSFVMDIAKVLTIAFLGVFLVYRVVVTSVVTGGSSPIANRPLDDWVSFSFRPWYFVLPPEKSIYFGDFSEKIFDNIKGSGHYLANDYDASEMAGAYLGWHFVFGLLVVSLGIFSAKLRRLLPGLDAHKTVLKKLLITFFGLFIIGLPPKIVVHGINIYFPSYLLFKFVPFFRVLTRLSIVMFLITLLINAYLLFESYSRMKLLGKLTTAVFFLLINYFIFAVEIPIVDLYDAPPYSNFLKNSDIESVVHYPEAGYKQVFWSLYHKKKILNPEACVSVKDKMGADAIVVKRDSIDEAHMQELSDFGYVVNEPIYEDSDVLVFARY